MMAHLHGEKISAYLDGMLDAAQMHRAAAHLAVCPQCRLALQELRQTKDLLEDLSAPPQPPAEFWASAYRQMRVEESRPLSWLDRSAIERQWRSPQRRLSAGLTAVAIIAGALTLPLLSHTPANNPHPPASAAAASPDSVDVSFLVQAHTESAAHQPLADTDRQDMIAMDDSFTAESESPGDLSHAGSDASP